VPHLSCCAQLPEEAQLRAAELAHQVLHKKQSKNSNIYSMSLTVNKAQDSMDWVMMPAWIRKRLGRGLRGVQCSAVS
jgi:hypothetical protein